MASRPVLILDTEIHTLANTGFLLQLAGFSVTKVIDVAEALNWATNRHYSNEPFSFITVSNLPGAVIRKMNKELDRIGIPLPILLVIRDEHNTGLDALFDSPHEARRLIKCAPGEIIETARSITDPPDHGPPLKEKCH